MKTDKFIFILFILIFALSGISLGKYSGGTGEPNAPYLIATPNDLNDIGNHVEDFNKHFIVVNDINMAGFTGTQFNIIGGAYPYFSGVFDGNDHQITRFTFIDNTQTQVGVFGRTAEIGEIRNVHLVDVNLCGYYDVGGLVGKNYGEIKDCSVSGVIVASEDFGGLVGENYGGGIERCNTDVTMQNYGVLSSYIGCLVGFNNEGIIVDCSSAGTVEGDSNTDKAGGLVGSNRGRIRRCYSTADVEGSWCIGGLIGDHDIYDLETCYATGDVLAEVRGGGLVGFSTCTVINCYATGDVNCAEASGGLIGEEGYGDAINCYSTGYVVGDQDVGGLVGVKYKGSFAGCFWDVNTSGQTTSAGGTGKITSEMKCPSTFSNAGWDVVEVWDIGENQTYPFLRTHLPSDINKDSKTDFYDFAILAEHWLGE